MEANNWTKLVIYETSNGETRLDVTVRGELERNATISKMETVVNRGFRGSAMEIVDHYNLDAILSVGYRVNSKNATAFRIWANKVLKQYLMQGYVVNERIAAQKFDELSQPVKVLGRTIQTPSWLSL